MKQPQRKPKGTVRRQATGARFKPRISFFKREAEWMTLGNLAPFGIGIILALVFWFTR